MNIHNWLEPRTIYVVQHGSRAYGTFTESSDYDYRGIVIPPKEYFLGFSKFEQTEYKGNNEEMVIYEFRKFITLAADANPNMLELLFIDPVHFVKCTPVATELLAHREDFLSKKIKFTFSGYAMAQLKRIETHRKWLLNPPPSPPNRKDYGLPSISLISQDRRDIANAFIKQKMSTWDLHLDELEDRTRLALVEHVQTVLVEMKMASESERFMNAGLSLGMSDNFMMILDKERQFATAQKNWDNYQSWLTHRNPERAAMEAKYGFDGKNALHMVRLLKMAEEILTTGEVHVKRPDAEELLSIRQGAWSYEQLMEWATEQEKRVIQAYQVSSLPHTSNRAKINELCIRLIEKMGW